MKLYRVLFEGVNDLITIVSYHWSNNPNLTNQDVTTQPRETRQSGRKKRKYVGFYVVMPELVNIESVEDLPTTIEANPEDGSSYGDYLYKVVIEVPRNNIVLDKNPLGSTRISEEDLTDKFNEKKFIYVPRAVPTAEGIVLDTNIITSFEKIEKTEL